MILRLSCLLVVLLAGCAPTLPIVRGHYDSLRERIHYAKASGAMECSPESLALAQAEYRFASLELSQGDIGRASSHVEEGLVAAATAVEQSEGCPSTGVSVKDLGRDPWPDADGDGVSDSQDKCPHELEDRDGFQDNDGCPEPDNDGDGIADREDQCPMEAEDLDGFGDEDGCPEDDDDQDGVADADDLCPAQAETKNGFLDSDGCPDFQPNFIQPTEDKVTFKRPLAFAEKTSVLLGTSHAALREVVQLLAVSPGVRLGISGHTSNRGDPEILRSQSEAMAKAVYDFLVSQGVDAQRLEWSGKAGDEPISTNRTRKGRKTNRRVELAVVEGRFPSGKAP